MFQLLTHHDLICIRIERVPLDKALNLSLYLKHDTEIMPVTQGFSELVPFYKLMEKRNMAALEHQLKVGYLIIFFIFD